MTKNWSIEICDKNNKDEDTSLNNFWSNPIISNKSYDGQSHTSKLLSVMIMIYKYNHIFL